MLAIAIFLGMVTVAAGLAYWNNWRSAGWDKPRDREEPRFTVNRL